jgi:hypothetical protein
MRCASGISVGVIPCIRFSRANDAGNMCARGAARLRVGVKHSTAVGPSPRTRAGQPALVLGKTVRNASWLITRSTTAARLLLVHSAGCAGVPSTGHFRGSGARPGHRSADAEKRLDFSSRFFVPVPHSPAGRYVQERSGPHKETQKDVPMPSSIPRKNAAGSSGGSAVERSVREWLRTDFLQSMLSHGR